MTRRTRLSKKAKSHKRNRLDKIAKPAMPNISEELLTKSEEAVLGKPAISEDVLGKAEDAAVTKPAISEELLTMAEEAGVSKVPLLPKEEITPKEELIPKKEIESFSLKKVFDDIKSKVQEEYESLSEKKEKVGGFLHEVVHLDTPEAVERSKNTEIAQRLMSQHPMDNVLLRAELHDEPVADAGLVGMVRAEDFLNFEHVEVTTPDGKVYTIPRDVIKEFVGVAPQAADIVMPQTAVSDAGLGTSEGVIGGVVNGSDVPSQGSQEAIIPKEREGNQEVSGNQ